MSAISYVEKGECEGGWVIEIRCTECDETEKFTVIGWTGPERVYAAVCAECSEDAADPAAPLAATR